MSPLRDVRILSFAVNLPGPVAVGLLRDLGASILKIEPPGGDPLSAFHPAWYADLCRGVDVMRIDAKTQSGRARVGELLTTADVIIVSSRPAALERLGLGWRELHVRYPRLCCVSILGYPGQRRTVPGHDLTYQAEQGLVAPPEMPRALIADLAGAQQVVTATLALVMARGRGQDARFAEVSLSECARFFAEPLARGLTAPGGPLGGGGAEYAIHCARDGWIAVAALEPHFRLELQRALGVDLTDSKAVAWAFAQRTAREWQLWAEERDLPIVAVHDPYGRTGQDSK